MKKILWLITAMILSAGIVFAGGTPEAEGAMKDLPAGKMHESGNIIKEGGARKVILDTDMVELFDDGMAMIMLDRSPKTELLGVTVVSGNTPMPKGLAFGVRQLEALGSTAPIYEGSRYGIRNWRANPDVMKAEMAISPVTDWAGYLNIAVNPEWFSGTEHDPMSDWREVYGILYAEKPVYPYVYGKGNPDKYGNDNAVDFMIDMVNRYPGEVTIAAIGPCTNVARAILKDPSFPSKVREIVYMGGAFYMEGNSSASAEFNWWADPEAAKICVRAQWGDPESETYKAYGNQMITGLEANLHTGAMPEELYHKMVEDTIPGLQELFHKRAAAVEANPGPWNLLIPNNIWDLFTVAYLIDPSIVLSWNNSPRPEGDIPQPIYGVYIDVNMEMGTDYGRSLAFREDLGPVGTQKAAIQNYIDEEKFWYDIVYPIMKDADR